jgi:hypothetical protein
MEKPAFHYSDEILVSGYISFAEESGILEN